MLQAVLGRVDRRFVEWLQYAAETDGDIPVTLQLPQRYASDSLYFVLTMTLGETPMMLRQAGESGHGFLFYRKLARKCDPTVSTRGLGMLRGIVNYKLPHKDFQAGVVAFELACARYMTKTKKGIDNDIKVNVALENAPREIQKQLELQVDEDRNMTFESLVQKVDDWIHRRANVDACTKIPKHDPDAMDVDALWEDGGGKGKGKDIICHNCGKPGHVQKDCWSKGKGGKDGKGGNGGKGGKGDYGGKGGYKGKDGYKDKFYDYGGGYGGGYSGGYGGKRRKRKRHG